MLYDIRFTHERQMTCPHLSSIGGFVGVLSSLDTGHEKTLWKRSSFGIGISTCSRVQQRECSQIESTDNSTRSPYRHLFQLVPVSDLVGHHRHQLSHGWEC